MTCPLCGYTTTVEAVRRQLKVRFGGANDARLICVVRTYPNRVGRFYRLPVQSDCDAINASVLELKNRIIKNHEPTALIPEGELNHLRGFFNVVLYGMTKWGDLFSPRQAVVLITLVRLVKEVGKRDKQLGLEDIAIAVQTCLAFLVDRMADGNSSLSRWQPTGQKISNTFGRQALPMVWDFCEANPFCESTRNLGSMLDWIVGVIEQEKYNTNPGHADVASAISHSLPDDAADAIFTDPPYYAAVPYADLSDFFYSWLKRSLSDIYPRLFLTSLAPKDEECVSLAHRAAMYRNKNNEWFEKMMAQACSEARRIVKPDGIGVFVFANKETSGWEAMISALLTSGWVITSSWPIDTEMGSRLRAMNSAALASSVHLVCRPRENIDGSVSIDDIGYWSDLLTELPKRIHNWMPGLASKGVVGADAIFSCLGPALEIYSRYSRVEKASGEVVPLKEYLEEVWAAVSHEALGIIFEGVDCLSLEEDARLTAMWLWTLSTGGNGGSFEDQEPEDDEVEGGVSGKGGKMKGIVLEYDAARKIAQGLGAHLETLSTLVEVNGDMARLLPVSERTPYLFGQSVAPASKRGHKKKKDQQTTLSGAIVTQAEQARPSSELSLPAPGSTVLDRLHQAMLLFSNGRSDALRRFIEEEIGQDQGLWSLAQSLSALYPIGSEERRWVEGVLSKKKSMGL
ncbi:Uncharacterised protein [uncultured archaeon]|nr:Uncharacterised protein [uncultured archaeon]